METATAAYRPIRFLHPRSFLDGLIGLKMEQALSYGVGQGNVVDFQIHKDVEVYTSKKSVIGLAMSKAECEVFVSSSATGRNALAAICMSSNMKTGCCVLSYKELAAMIDCNERSIIRGVAELIKRGALNVERNYATGKGAWSMRNNFKRLLAGVAGVTNLSPGGDKNVHQRGDKSVSQRGDKIVTPTDNKVKDNKATSTTYVNDKEEEEGSDEPTGSPLSTPTATTTTSKTPSSETASKASSETTINPPRTNNERYKDIMARSETALTREEMKFMLNLASKQDESTRSALRIYERMLVSKHYDRESNDHLLALAGVWNVYMTDRITPERIGKDGDSKLRANMQSLWNCDKVRTNFAVICECLRQHRAEDTKAGKPQSPLAFFATKGLWHEMLSKGELL